MRLGLIGAVVCLLFAAPCALASDQTPEEVLEIAANGAAAGCTEALFTLGDRPEERWPAAREQLAELGYDSTVEYVAAVSRLVLRETGLLPHTNVGLLSAHEMAALREVSASQGLMLESVSPRLLEKGGAHQGCATPQHHSSKQTQGNDVLLLRSHWLVQNRGS